MNPIIELRFFMKKINIIILALSSIIFMECGRPGVNINDAGYEPKIAVEGYLYCGETIKDIRLSRNYAIGVPIDSSSLYLTPSGNNVIITINGVPLYFDQSTNTYFNRQVTVDFNKTYTLAVSAIVDGQNLQTTSTTTTPQKGFAVFNNNLGQFTYDGNPITVNFKTSPGTDFYVFSIVPDTASTANFIYNNVLRKNIDSSDVVSNFNDFKFRDGILDNINSNAGIDYSFTLQLQDTWFYSSYTIIAYAGDTNFKDYFLTAPNVEEFDGNFHEPIQIFTGAGIGVFASAIRDTVKFSIVRY
jgi:hypothetical protein